MKWTILETGLAKSGEQRKPWHSGKPGFVRVRCVCGHEAVIAMTSITRGRSTQCKSCSAIEKKTIHGQSQTREYKIWTGIVKRTNEGTRAHKHPSYKHVRLADEWKGYDGFVRFLHHIGPPPSDKHQIDRIESTGHYEPGNVRWRTVAEQQRNRRDNRNVTWDGRTMTVTEWSRALDMPPMTLINRLNRWPVERAMTEPIRRKRST